MVPVREEHQAPGAAPEGSGCVVKFVKWRDPVGHSALASACRHVCDRLRKKEESRADTANNKDDLLGKA
jgi:hypothetical protein